MLKTTRSQVIAIVSVLALFILIAFATRNRDATFKKKALLTVAMITTTDPTRTCDSELIFVTPHGYYAKCSATGGAGSSQVYGVTVTFWQTLEEAKTGSKPQLGRAYLVFEKPQHLTNIAFQREGGNIFD